MGLAIDKFEYSTSASAQAAYVPVTLILVGLTATGTTADSANYVNFCGYTATSNGYTKTINIYSANGSQNIKVALYVHSGTAPTTLLATGSGVTVANTWNAIAITEATINSGGAYTIGAAITANSQSTYWTTTGKNHWYKTITFATYSFPSPFTSTGYTMNTSQGYAFVSSGVAMQAYSEATTKSEGSYSLKGVVVDTAGVGKTLTKTFT